MTLPFIFQLINLFFVNFCLLLIPGKDQAWHWSDALTGIHLIKLDGNTVTHLNRRLNTTSLQAATATKGFPFIGYGTPPNAGPRPTGGQDPDSPFKKKRSLTERLAARGVTKCEMCCSLKSPALAAACDGCGTCKRYIP